MMHNKNKTDPLRAVNILMRNYCNFAFFNRDQKENIICTMDDVRGDFLRPPHGTTPAGVIANKNKTDRLRAVNILMREWMGHTAVSATLASSVTL